MKLSELFLLVLFLFSLSACVSQQPDTKSKCYATEYVNPFIGTGIRIPEHKLRSVWCS